KYLDKETIAELTKLVLTGSTSTEEMFRRLWNTRSMPDYPLNVGFLDQILGSMSMADRDLRWTEWLRRERADILRDVRWLEEGWRANGAVGSQPDALRARWVTWVLTSTVRELRDQATRTLYWYGRANPAVFFDLTIDSLAINAPYVSERMLAASSGAAAPLQDGQHPHQLGHQRL